MAKPRRGTRAESGMIHDHDFTVPFQKTLEVLRRRFPDNCLAETVSAKQIDIVLATLKGLVFRTFEDTFWRLCRDGIETEAGRKKWRNHKDVLTKVCTGKYEGRILPAYVVECIREMQHSRLQSLLAHVIIAAHNHRFARTKNIPATIPLHDPYNRLSTWPGDPEPPETFRTYTYGIAPEPGPNAPPSDPHPPPPPPPLPPPAEEQADEGPRQEELQLEEGPQHRKNFSSSSVRWLRQPYAKLAETRQARADKASK
jgi:hypothetical protein